MNICMLSRVMPAHSIGGMQDHVQTLSAALVARGHRVSVITTARADGVENEESCGVEIHYLRNTTPARYSPAYWRASARKVEDLDAAQPFDILHSHSIGAYGIYRARLHRHRRVPMIASLHGTHLDVLTTAWHTDFSLLRPLGAARFAAVVGQMLYNYAARDLWFIRALQIVVATSDADEAKYKFLYRLSEDKIRKVYNGIDTTLFAPTESISTLQSLREQLRISPDTRIILALARLQKDKGVQNAIAVLPRVLERFPACLVIVGDGDYRTALERFARASGVAAHTRFVGAQPLVECARYFNLCDVFVDPTLRTDGYDLTIAEALACAKPVIASDVGANSTLIDPAIHRDGALIPRGDNDALAHEILRVFGDSNFARAMGEMGRAKIVERFSVPAMVKGMERVYKELIGIAR